jgi:hypothetical protein
MHDFITSHIGHLENTGSLGCTDLINIYIIHYTMIKFVGIIIPLVKHLPSMCGGPETKKKNY